MNVYLDSSIVLRRLRREAPALPTWAQWQHAYASVLLRVEVLRTLDRIRLSGRVVDAEVAELIVQAREILAVVELVPLSDAILNRASQSFSTAVGTLDALHLGTALELVQGGIDLTFLTHDAELAVAARTLNFAVEGA